MPIDAMTDMTDPQREQAERCAAIVADMRMASDAVDDAVGTSEYQARLVALALIARHYLRELDQH